MEIKRTKKLTLKRALKILQLRYGTQVQNIRKNNNFYIADSICNTLKEFSRTDILNIEDQIYSSFGC